METITSRENAKIKYACRLQEEEKLPLFKCKKARAGIITGIESRRY